ncbi:MAG: RNA polymerase subunit sigma-70 [Lachnospiraceae bacterium]|nr:RNA polymerase subunit sigma-70 [Lachnospiraceae bacterium]
MNKDILNQYIDACALIQETEEDIRRVKKQRKTIVQDRVHGSMQDFPYAAQSFKIQGMSYSVVSDPGALDAYERLLEERKEAAAVIKIQVEAWMNMIPQRMQRIIKFKIFEENTWEQVARKMGRKATADGVKMEFRRFMEKS